MQVSRIYHGGGTGKSRGWHGCCDGKYLVDRVWIPAVEFYPHPSSPCGTLAARVFPNGVAVRCLTFASNQLDVCYVWVPAMKYWTYKFSAPTGISMKVVWGMENTSAPANQVKWKYSLSYVRNNETMNFVPPVMTDLDSYTTYAYALRIRQLDDVPIYDPSGAGTVLEGCFYFKFERDGPDPWDTYPYDCNLYGVYLDFPLQFP
jgi:hypothetical protein